MKIRGVEAVTPLAAGERMAETPLGLLFLIGDNIPIGLAFVDSEIRYAYANARFAAIHGRRPDQFLGRTPEEVLPADLAAAATAAHRYVLSTGEPITSEARRRVTCPDLGDRELMVSHHPVRGLSGVVLGVTTVMQDVTRLAQAEDALRLSEERYRDIVETQTDLVCRFLPDTTLTFVNEAYCQFFKRTRAELLGSSLLRLLPESAHEETIRYIESLIADPRTQVIEHEVVLPDGTTGWQQWVDHVILGPDGTVKELQGIGRDITYRKRAEAELQEKEVALRESHRRIQDLAGRLIAAQETERTRIARELHDGISQQLAALSITLSSVKRRLPEEVPGLRTDLASLQSQAAQLAADVRNLSHEYHSGVLHYAGLVPALRSRCDELRVQHGVQAELSVDGEVDDIPGDIAMCVYRVAQEALRNVGSHSQASDARLSLSRRRGVVTFRVRDNGCGFDLVRAKANGGLGLLSIEERVRLVGGTVSIKSNAGGTELRVSIGPRPATESVASACVGAGVTLRALAPLSADPPKPRARDRVALSPDRGRRPRRRS